MSLLTATALHCTRLLISSACGHGPLVSLRSAAMVGALGTVCAAQPVDDALALLSQLRHAHKTGEGYQSTCIEEMIGRKEMQSDVAAHAAGSICGGCMYLIVGIAFRRVPARPLFLRA